MAHTTKLSPNHTKQHRLSQKEREHFTADLALLLKAAVPVGDALSSLSETSGSARLRKRLEGMRQDVDDGLPLWQALERSNLVSQQTLTLVQFGEQSGTLVDNLRLAAKQEEKQRTFHAKVRLALLYPAFVFVTTILVSIGVAWFLLPRLADTFTQVGVQLPFISKVLVNIGVFLRSDGVWFVPLACVVVLLGGYTIFAAPKTRSIGQWLLLRTPGIGKLLREIEIARFGYLTGTLLDAGVSITKALRLLRDASAIPAYQRLYRHLYEQFDEGFSLRESLSSYKHASRLLPPTVQQMLIAAERSGALPETLRSISDMYEEKADLSAQNLETVLEPILLVIVALSVLGIAVAVILPIYSLIGGLGG